MQLSISPKRISSIAIFELVRLFKTKSGALTLLAFATVWLIILYYFVSSAVDVVSSGSFKDIAINVFGALGIEDLLSWPVPELAIYWLVALYSFPFFTILFTNDQTCGDKSRGTLRFITLRTTRSELLFGRFIGQVVIMAILIALTLIATMLMATLRDPSASVYGFSIGVQIFIDLFVVVLPFIALMTFFNTFSNSSKLVIVYAVLFFGILPLALNLIEYLLGLGQALHYIIPGVQIDDVVNPADLTLVSYVIPLIQTIFYTALALIMMKRSSL